MIVLDEWVMFDDDEVTGITSEDILKLSGGGMYTLSFSIFVRVKSG